MTKKPASRFRDGPFSKSGEKGRTPFCFSVHKGGRVILSAGEDTNRPIMMRFLMWTEGDENGWACSNCRWKFPVPTLLSEKEAKSAYDRLADVKFREHKCESEISPAAGQLDPGRDAFADRARKLIKQGYTPKVAVDLILHEMQFEQGSGPKVMERARADAEDFLLKVRKGLI